MGFWSYQMIEIKLNGQFDVCVDWMRMETRRILRTFGLYRFWLRHERTVLTPVWQAIEGTCFKMLRRTIAKNNEKNCMRLFPQDKHRYSSEVYSILDDIVLWLKQAAQILIVHGKIIERMVSMMFVSYTRTHTNTNRSEICSILHVLFQMTRQRIILAVSIDSVNTKLGNNNNMWRSMIVCVCEVRKTV